MIRLTIDMPMPGFCAECPFCHGSWPDVVCASLGDISEWSAPDDLSSLKRHPGCPLEEP